MALKIDVIGKTDRGLVRSGNEDYLHIDHEHRVYAVCDGMGGHQAGEVASMTASETIRLVFESFRQELAEDSRLELDPPLPPNGSLLVKAIRMANREVYQKAESDLDLRGMGTTIVAVTFDDDMMTVAHVGDSRAYLMEEKRLHPLTRDHSWVAELQQSQNVSEDDLVEMVGRNVITRALGVRENVEIDYRLVQVSPGDELLLCSDGLCGFADDQEIFDVAHPIRSDLRKLVDSLIKMANDRGGSDNVTVIAARINEVDKSEAATLDVQTLPEETSEQLQIEDELLSKLAVIKTEEKQRQPQKAGGNSKRAVMLIFLAFLLVATAIIFFQGVK